MLQGTTGPNLEFYDVVATYPGSVHDARVFDNSAVRVRFEQGELGGVLLADNGYPNRNYMITPLLNPTTAPEQRYNAAHIRTRSTVERAFGTWKQRFRCLLRGLTNKLKNVPNIVIATAVLHNISRNVGEPNIDCEDDDDDNEQSDSEMPDVMVVDVHATQAARRSDNRCRQNLIDSHFH